MTGYESSHDQRVDRYGLHNRDTSDDAFYEWLLSDHPAARAERDRRRAASYEVRRGYAFAAQVWADKIIAAPDATQPMRKLARSVRPRTDVSLRNLQAGFAEPDEAYVARHRSIWETYMRVSSPAGSWDYRYPARLTGPEAANHPPPEPPQPDEPEDGSLEEPAEK